MGESQLFNEDSPKKTTTPLPLRNSSNLMAKSLVIYKWFYYPCYIEIMINQYKDPSEPTRFYRSFTGVLIAEEMAIDNFRGSQEVTRAAHTPHVRDIGRLMHLDGVSKVET